MLNLYELKKSFLLIMTKSRRLILLIYNLSSLLTRKNLVRITTYIRLFGFKTTFNEVNKKLWQDNYFLYGEIKSIPPIKIIKRLEDGSVPFEDTTISIVIPVKNPGNDFQNLLSLMKNQKGFKDVELIVVDSGSTDNSLQIAKEFGAKIIKTLPEEFSHSYSRNLGASHSSGDYLLFTVQDALPPNDIWLYELFSVIKDNNVAAATCAETTREDSDLFYRAISWNHLNFMEMDNKDRIMVKPEIENYLSLKKNGQLNNVACLISRDVFVRYKFRHKYAEDLDLGIRLIRDGHKLGIIGSTRIIHSHNRPAYNYLKRGYVEHLYFSKLLPNFPNFALDLEQLICEIVFNYRLLNSLVCSDFQLLGVPCTIKKLSRFIMKRLYNPHKYGNLDIIDTKRNGYIDNKFRDFLDNLFTQKEYKIIDEFALDGILLDKMHSYTTLILEFMDNTYELIDNNLLEELKASLYREYAFICGMLLASSFIKYSVEEDQKYGEINDELTRYL